MDPYQQLYEALRQETSECRNKGLNLLEQTDCSLRIARHYRGRLPLPGVPVDSISYFRRYLPLFEAEILYYERQAQMHANRPASRIHGVNLSRIQNVTVQQGLEYFMDLRRLSKPVWLVHMNSGCGRTAALFLRGLFLPVLEIIETD